MDTIKDCYEEQTDRLLYNNRYSVKSNLNNFLSKTNCISIHKEDVFNINGSQSHFENPIIRYVEHVI